MKNVNKLVLVILMFVSGYASSANITFGSPTTNVNLNDIFTIDIVGNGFTSNVDGGGVNLSFDQSILNVLSVSINETVWDFGGSGISTGTINNTNGTVGGIMVNTFSSVSGSFIVATLQMQAISTGLSALSLTEFTSNPWSSGGSALNPDYQGADVIVTTVPVPAAAWLFGSGILGLFGVARRRKA